MDNRVHRDLRIGQFFDEHDHIELPVQQTRQGEVTVALGQRECYGGIGLLHWCGKFWHKYQSNRRVVSNT